LCAFLHTNKWIYETAIITFFESELSKKLPQNWVEALSGENILLSNLLSAIDTHPQFKQWPSSLQAYLIGCRDLAMPRKPSKIQSSPIALKTSPISELDPTLCVGMKSKKIHEVIHLSNVIHNLCGDFCEIVDVGSGKGYIAQVLSHHFGYHVIGLEGNEGQHEKAAERFAKTEMLRIPKKQRFLAQTGAASSSLPTPEVKHSTVNYFLEYGVSSNDLDALVAPSLSLPTSPICLMSLHACGDLSPCLLELFSNWNRATTLVNVACCYHKIAPKSLENKKGFPMSSMISHFFDTGLNLSPFSYCLELATGCPLQWQQMDEEALEIRINKLAFRSILQLLFTICLSQDQILAKEYDHFKLHVRKQKSDAVFKNLTDYLNAALPRCTLKRNLPDATPTLASELSWDWNKIQLQIHSQAESAYTQYEPQRNAMKIWLALQSCMTSVAESLVIFDRWQYLEEYSMKMVSKKQGEPGTKGEKTGKIGEENSFANLAESSVSQKESSCEHTSSVVQEIIPWIVPIFNQEESPRNLALVATKRRSKIAN
jgi:hypothetical protein